MNGNSVLIHLPLRKRGEDGRKEEGKGKQRRYWSPAELGWDFASVIKQLSNLEWVTSLTPFFMYVKIISFKIISSP